MQGQSLGDVVAAGAHVRGAPDGEPDGRRVAAVVLEMAGEQRLGGAAAKRPGGGGRHRAVVERIEIAPGGQDIEPTAGRRAGRTGRDEAAGKAGEQGGDLAAAAGPDGRPDPALDRSHDGSAGGARRGGAAGDNGGGQRLQALHGVARRAPWSGIDAVKEGRAGALPGFAQLGRQRIEARGRGPGRGRGEARRRRPSLAARQHVTAPPADRSPDGPQGACPECAGRRGSGSP